MFYEWDRRIWRRAKGAAAIPQEDNQISTRLGVYNNIRLNVLIHVGDKESCGQSTNTVYIAQRNIPWSLAHCERRAGRRRKVESLMLRVTAQNHHLHNQPKRN